MTLSIRTDKAAMVRIVWMLTALTFFGGGLGLVWWPSSQTLAQIRGHASEMYEEANQNESEVRRAAELRVVQARVLGDLNHLAGQHSSGAMTAVALRLFNEESKRFHVDVRTIVPDAPVTDVKAPRDMLVPTEMTLGVRGRFHDVVEMLADLPRHDVLVDVHDVDLASTNSYENGVPNLDVTIHATVYRVRMTASPEVALAPGTL